MMEGAADQKLANGRGGVPLGRGASPRLWRKKKGGNKGGGCSSSIVLDSKGLPVLPPPPPAEEAINRLNAGWPGGSSLIG